MTTFLRVVTVNLIILLAVIHCMLYVGLSKYWAGDINHFSSKVEKWWLEIVCFRKCV